ncbi:DUF1977-domain-containing protein [Xylona heveae TC161]|uniref:DUF1977-domain-containing protein n=1 Tax=Xylona heveae (strain CBS 132557 / TC161) TaxID=1328760 RepID=A0A161THM5_XYLHT|nr:DUF1977-domain-containing protein [Xylona heveae TC161]KZF25757.1 DUF1977-domain-containing protein [Xylona heveae TC161]
MPPSATASGADTGPSGSAKSRDHSQGNQDRKYTVDQKATVIRVRRCSPTAYYDILGLEEVKTTVTDGEIKKAYRKLSLLTHPDKNGYDGADEAFKLVSRAFQVLSDPDKRAKFDRFGGDPDSRFGGSSASAGASPFSEFARGAGGARPGGMWEEEISPEEMFNRFFGGGLGGGFGPFGGGGFFDAGPQFVFNLNGGPGFRVHQFGGARPRRRPREANNTSSSDNPTASTLASALPNLLPLLLLFLLPLLSSIFSSTTAAPKVPAFRFDTPAPPYTLHRTTPHIKIDYFVNPNDVEEYSPKKFKELDNQVEVRFVNRLQSECRLEMDNQARLAQEAQGWFFQDTDKMQRARDMELRSCSRLDGLHIRRAEYRN